MTEQWQELKETITELRDNDGTGTQQEVCRFLANLMDVLEKQKQDPSISEDGTLTVNVGDGSKVNRVLVCGDDHFGGLYYPEQSEE